jgi:hypothetical protein
VILSTLGVGLATSVLQIDRSFEDASYGFTIALFHIHCSVCDHRLSFVNYSVLVPLAISLGKITEGRVMQGVDINPTEFIQEVASPATQFGNWYLGTQNPLVDSGMNNT